jgi:hypothetical protein
VPTAAVTVDGAALPFPAGQDDGPLRQLIKPWAEVGLDEGVRQTIARFRELLDRGLLRVDAA